MLPEVDETSTGEGRSCRPINPNEGAIDPQKGPTRSNHSWRRTAHRRIARRCEVTARLANATPAKTNRRQALSRDHTARDLVGSTGQRVPIWPAPMILAMSRSADDGHLTTPSPAMHDDRAVNELLLKRDAVCRYRHGAATTLADAETIP